MRVSLIRFHAMSALCTMLVIISIVVAYVSTVRWEEDQAMKDGVFLVHETLSSIKPTDRAAALAKLQPHYRVPLSIETTSNIQSLWKTDVGRIPMTYHRVSILKHAYLLTFPDSNQVLIAGPINPAAPEGVLPIGLIVGVLAIPLLHFFIAYFMESSFRKIETVNQAIAEGNLSIRMDDKTPFMTEYSERFNEMADKIEALIHEKEELIQAVSHELGSPLSRIRLHLSLMNEPTELKEQRLGHIKEELDRLDALIRELMDYVQPPQVNLQQFTPMNIIKESMELAVLDHRKVDVRFDLYDRTSSPFQIIADAKLFQRVMDNLIRNAVAHAKQEFAVELTETTEHIGIFVHDDGVGIPEAHYQEIFEPFFKLKPGGTGLGLAIVHRIVHKHTGLLSVDESFLGGAVFKVYWKKA